MLATALGMAIAMRVLVLAMRGGALQSPQAVNATSPSSDQNASSFNVVEIVLATENATRAQRSAPVIAAMEALFAPSLCRVAGTNAAEREDATQMALVSVELEHQV